MADFEVTIADGGDKTRQQKLAGVTAAREAYNANIPMDSPGPFATDQEYVDFVMNRAAESYANQYNT